MDAKGSGAPASRLAGGAVAGLQRRAKRCLAGAVLFACTCLLGVSLSILVDSSPASQLALALLRIIIAQSSQHGDTKSSEKETLCSNT